MKTQTQMEETKVGGLTKAQFEAATSDWTKEDFEELKEYKTTDDVMLCLYEYLTGEHNLVGDIKLEALFERQNEIISLRNAR